MRGRSVLVTGVSHPLGAAVALRLASEPDVDVVGVDHVAPRRHVRSAISVVRADIRSPLIARVLADAEVDTVVHLGVVASAAEAGGRGAMREQNVLGGMQLMAACQALESLNRLVVRSSTAVYGSTPTDPAVFTEATEPVDVPRRGFAHDMVELESYVRSLARRRRDVAVTTLRTATLVGPDADSPLQRYLSLPVVPTVLGYDPRLQLLHSDDAVAAFVDVALRGPAGTFNLAGDGVVPLSQAVRRARRLGLPIAAPLVGVASRVLRQVGGPGLPAEGLRAAEHGRVVDTSAFRAAGGRAPTLTSLEALDAAVTGLIPPPPFDIVGAVGSLVGQVTGSDRG